MALLTNINGKFSVSDVGAVTFNNAFTFPTADGAANYVLQTNGSGQLAWALNGNGDISGSGTANTVTKFTGSGTGVKTIGNGPITFSGNESTFTGRISVTGDISADNYINIEGATNPYLRIQDITNEEYLNLYSSDNESAIVYTQDTFKISSGVDFLNQTPRLTINSSGNATFTGDITVTGGDLTLGTDSIASNINAIGDVLGINVDSNTGGGAGANIQLKTAGTTQLTINNSSAAFAGTISSGAITAPTFSGDLNGTINTVTTATTKGNSTNDTTVATTAFVQNVVGTIPAGLVFQGTWNASTNSPTLTSGSGTTGNFYIVSVAGSTNLDGITDWQVGDWAVFIEQGASDQWEKIDNSSVLGGSGTGGSFAGWSGSGTSVTLGNAPVTFSGNNSTFAGDIYVTGTSNSLVVISRDNMYVDAGQLYIGADDATTDDSFRQRTASGSYFIESRKSGTWTNRLQINTAGTLIGSQGATFAGNVLIGATSAAAGVLVVDGNSANNIWVVGRDSDGTGSLSFRNAADNAYNARLEAVSGELKFETNGTLALTIDANQNATFASAVWIPDYIYHVGDANSKFGFSGADTYIVNTGGTNALTIDSSQNATFAGNVEVRSGNKLILQRPNNGVATEISTDSTGAMILNSINDEGFFFNNAGTNAFKLDPINATFAGTVTAVGISSNIASATSGYFATGTAIPANQIVHIRDNVATTSVNSAGGIKISSSPGNDVFLLKRNATTSSFFALQNSSASEFITVNMASGNVGIGTASPLSKLTVSEGTNQHGIELAPGTLSYLQCYDRATSDYGNMTIDAKYLAFGLDNGTEKIRFTADGKVGIGTSSPGSYDGESDDLVVFNSTTPGITIATDNTASRGALRFADGTSGNETYRGAVEYNHNGDDMSFRTAGTQKMTLTDAGNLLITSGNVGIGTTSPATTLDARGSGATSNSLQLQEQPSAQAQDLELVAQQVQQLF